MIRPRQVRLKLNKSQFQHCQKLSQESAKVWNTVKNFFWRTDPSQAQDNKRVAQISRLQSRCKKDSRRFKQLQAVKSKVQASCHRRTRDLNHKITRLAVDWCVEHNIGKLVIGDVTGIVQDTNNEKRLNRKNRQKVSQWSFYQQRQYLQYKCDEVGIETALEPENQTSKTMFVRCAHYSFN